MSLSRRDLLASSGAMLAMTLPLDASAATPKAKNPLIIGHRGCSGERPEHTLAAYSRAIEQGADLEGIGEVLPQRYNGVGDGGVGAAGHAGG